MLWGFRKGCDFIKKNCNGNFDEFKNESGCDLHHVGVNFNLGFLSISIFYFINIIKNIFNDKIFRNQLFHQINLLIVTI